MLQQELGWGSDRRPGTSDDAGDARGAQEVLRGEVVFASAEEQAQRGAELLGAGALLVTLPPPTAEARGRLSELLEELVERELARMGAPSPYLAAWTAMPEDAQARLSDQLFRARTVGASGLAIAMGSLRALAAPVLCPDDSATLRWLAGATEEAPLVVLVDDADPGLLGYAPPVSLAAMLATRRRPAEVTTLEDPGDAPVTIEEPPIELTGDDATTNDTRVTAGASAGPSDAWRSWVSALSGARGAQPPAVFERLFVESYAPLANAIAGGLDDPRAVRTYDEFRRSFERSYTDAFATFGATNRRPRLVMDAYDHLSKHARLANARSSHLLVVDSMRFDLGCMVRDALLREAAGVASLTSEALLWSALPTTSMRQIDTFRRGLDALREPRREEPSESLRGRAAEVVRRLRVGSRELFKLDLVPAMLDAARGQAIGALEGIAAQVAESIARHVSTLPPRTLLLVLGDHGFRVDRHGEIETGGASPEEVLVPAFTWLIGDLH